MFHWPTLFLHLVALKVCFRLEGLREGAKEVAVHTGEILFCNLTCGLEKIRKWLVFLENSLF
jgi:hypothetical protein